MRGEKLIIDVYWLWLEEENGSGVFKPHSIRWKAKYTNPRKEIISQSGDAKNVKDMFGQIVSRFGGELKDLDNECHVEIRCLEEGIIGETFLATKKYNIRAKLSLKEQCILAGLLNHMKQGNHKRNQKHEMPPNRPYGYGLID